MHYSIGELQTFFDLTTIFMTILYWCVHLQMYSGSLYMTWTNSLVNYYNSLSYIFSIVNLVNIYTESNGPDMKTKAITQKWSTSVLLLTLLTIIGSAKQEVDLLDECISELSHWLKV